MAPVKVPPVQVRVRMYRQGLGDCFLLSFPTGDGKSFHMLVDCGVVLGHKKERNGIRSPSFKQVLESIRNDTGGTLDLVVVTHEHWDHVIGFNRAEARPIWQQMKVKKLWFAWTENPGDPEATSLKDRLKATRQALREAIARADPQAIQPIARVLEFFGATEDKNKGTAAAMKAARDLLKGRDPEYLDPKDPQEPRALDNVPGVRVYVLGPPHDTERIKHVDPSAGEAYLTRKPAGDGALSLTQAFLLARCGENDRRLTPADRERAKQSLPFNENLRLPTREAQTHEFFKPRYYSPRNKWRRIDDDWLGMGEELALQLDNYTNNTSLALAIELVKSGKVLILAADAQMGNWQSWGKLEWKVKNGDMETTVRIGDLLKRTVLYKVGHHGSVNASLKEFVDQMARPDLVAMLPVDHADAVAVKWNDMPWPRLLQSLAGPGNGAASRVIVQMDHFPTQKPQGMKDADWQAFRSRFEENELYMQYTVTD